jgi:hypothetical protein
VDASRPPAARDDYGHRLIAGTDLAEFARVPERRRGRRARPVLGRHPRPRPSARLFTLGPGQVGRYRANFRFIGCACDPSWFYESWLVHVSDGNVAADRFIRGRPDRDVDDRVHLYGATRSPAGRRQRQ